MNEKPMRKLTFSQNLAAATGLGASCSFGLAPYNQWWLLFIAVPIAILGLQGLLQNNAWRIFLAGWCFGFGYFIFAMHWIGFAFFVNGTHDLWMMPLALGGLSAFLALYWAVATVIAALLARRGHPLWLSVPPAFAAMEWLRGHLFTGFPWSVFGQMVDGMGGVEQAAAFVGMTGLTFLIWAWAASVYGIWVERGWLRWSCVLMLLSFPATLLLGQWRLATHPTVYVPGIMLRLVQPNISQNEKWREGNARKIFDQLLSLTSAPSSTGLPVTHVIWPESSIPFLVDESPTGRAEIAHMLLPGQTLLAGAVRRSAPRDDAAYFTSILVFDSNANVLNHYDKWKLVPGGEFLPLAWLLEPLGLRKLAALPESFTAGGGATTLPVPGAGMAGFSICYEAIFPEAVASAVGEPDWLINVTNDGWFGNSSGPWQHLAQMRLRAIETGAPAVRVANTGISAVIDAYGREVFTSKLNAAGAFDVVLPQRGIKFGNGTWLNVSLLLLLFCAIVLGEIAKRR